MGLGVFVVDVVLVVLLGVVVLLLCCMLYLYSVMYMVNVMCVWWFGMWNGNEVSEISVMDCKVL